MKKKNLENIFYDLSYTLITKLEYDQITYIHGNNIEYYPDQRPFIDIENINNDMFVSINHYRLIDDPVSYMTRRFYLRTDVMNIDFVMPYEKKKKKS